MTVSASPNDTTADLIIDTKAALATPKPIYDCACFEKLTKTIKRNWLPPKGSTFRNNVVIAFKINESGHTTDIRVVHTSGMALSDRAALTAIEVSQLDYVPLGSADIAFNFDYIHGSGIIGPKIIQGQNPNPAPPPVVYVKSMMASAPGVLRPDCSVHTDLNNQGVIELLKGKASSAADLFEQSIHDAPNYSIAAHNLAIAKQAQPK